MKNLKAKFTKLPSWAWAIILYVGGILVVGAFSTVAHYVLAVC